LKSEVIGGCGEDGKKRMNTRNGQKSNAKMKNTLCMKSLLIVTYTYSWRVLTTKPLGSTQRHSVSMVTGWQTQDLRTQTSSWNNTWRR